MLQNGCRLCIGVNMVSIASVLLVSHDVTSCSGERASDGKECREAGQVVLALCDVSPPVWPGGSVCELQDDQPRNNT